MKTLVISGNIGKDAVVRRTQDGTAITGWSVAVEDRAGKEKSTIWFDCSLWGKRGEALCQYLTKGSRVTVSGELTTREHEGKTYLGVRANEVALQGGGQKQDRQEYGDAASGDRAPQNGQGAPAGGYDDMSDEIPFACEWR